MARPNELYQSQYLRSAERMIWTEYSRFACDRLLIDTPGHLVTCQNFPPLASMFVWRFHDDVFKWKHFPRYWPFVRGIHRSPVNSLQKGQWRRALMFSLIFAWINGWVNNRAAAILALLVEVPDLGPNCTHQIFSLRFLYYIVHDDVIKSKHFPRHWPFVRGVHRSPVDSPHRGQWRGALTFSLTCASTNGWANNRDTGNLRRHRAHYDVTVMILMKLNLIPFACINSLPSYGAKHDISLYWSTVARAMAGCRSQAVACYLRSQAIAWTNTDLRLLSSIPILFFKCQVISQCLNKILHCCPDVMMTSSNGNIFRVTGHLCGKFTGPRWISRTMASDAELWCFLWFTPE